MGIVNETKSLVNALSIENNAMSLKTTAQLRAARALVRMSQGALAEASGVSLPTVKRLEGSEGTLPARMDTIEKLERALRSAGVDFTDENGGEPGVRPRR